MKKILLFATFLCGILNFTQAQILPWDTAHIGGMGNGNMQFYSSAVYNNTYYIGGGDNSTSLSKLFFSYDGFTYDTLQSYTSAKDPMDMGISNIDTASGKMFFTANNSVNGATFYVMNGTTVNYVGQPGFVGGPGFEFTYASALKHFNVGGIDSLYVAYENYTNGAEVWKTSVNPPYNWTLALATPDSISGIYDLAMFNGKIYAAAQLGYIYESTDGVNWTINAASSNGFNNNNVDCFNVLSVFNNRLFTGTSAWSSANSIWSTADGITWDSLSITNVNVGAITAISQFVTVNGNLWVSINADYSSALTQHKPSNQTMGVSTGPIILESIDGGLSFDRRSINGFGEFNNDFLYTLTQYKNNLFAAGQCLYGAGGRVYHTCFAPGSSITESLTTDTTCIGMSPTFFNNPIGAQNFEWYDNGGLVALAQNTNVFFSTSGLHEIKVVSHNYACTDSASIQIFANPAIVSDSVTYPAIGCSGTNMTLVGYFSNATPPLSYVWYDGFTNVGFTQSISIPVANTTSTTVTVTDKHGCTQMGFCGFVNQLNSTPIYGTINYSLGSVTNGNMYLIAQGSSSAMYDTITIAPINGTGDYLVAGLTAGNYYIRAEANSGSYPDLENTYYGNHYLWDSALVITHGCTQVDTFNITMVEIPVVTGPATLAGVVYEGAGFGQRVDQGPGVNPFANVIPGVPVKVGKNPSGSIVATTFTDTNGEYNISNLPYDTYRIYTDIPGYPMDSSYLITVNASSDSVINLDYYVDSNSVYVDVSTTTINSITQTEISQVYPNPANGSINIKQFFAQDGNVQISVNDLNGKELISKSVKSNKNLPLNYQLDISNLSKGIYTLRLILNGKTTITKIIVY